MCETRRDYTIRYITDPGFGILGTSYRSLLLLSKQSERLVAMGSSRRCKVQLGSVIILWVSPLLLRAVHDASAILPVVYATPATHPAAVSADSIFFVYATFFVPMQHTPIKLSGNGLLSCISSPKQVSELSGRFSKCSYVWVIFEAPEAGASCLDDNRIR